eukprot:UN27111
MDDYQTKFVESHLVIFRYSFAVIAIYEFCTICLTYFYIHLVQNQIGNGSFEIDDEIGTYNWRKNQEEWNVGRTNREKINSPPGKGKDYQRF